MTYLTDIVDAAILAERIDSGHVKLTNHPTEPYSILNYTSKAQYESVWDEVTTVCRGLIFHRDAGEIVARPFRKFFNYSQVPTPAGDAVAVTDKKDGSIGILYRLTDGSHAIATRGSFTSDQAMHATDVYLARYRDFVPTPGYTYLFEIIYPENRVVLDYGAMDDLVLIGIVDTVSGRSVPAQSFHWHGWPGPIVESLPYSSLTEALAAPPRPNAEGLVVHFIETDERLKIKQEDYVRLHRLIFGVSSKTIYEVLRNGDSLDDLLDRVPDEFYAWVMATVEELKAEQDRVMVEGDRLFRDAWATASVTNGIHPHDPGFPKAFALALDQTHPLHPIAFALRAGKTPDYWRYVEPKRSTPFASRSEDAD